jgi:hypothetical protein
MCPWCGERKEGVMKPYWEKAWQGPPSSSSYASSAALEEKWVMGEGQRQKVKDIN